MQEITESSRDEKKEKSSTGIPVRAYFMACVRNWYWFVISVIACACIAFLYGKSQSLLYSTQAYILITSGDKAAATAGSQTQVFSDLGVNTGAGSVSNEMYKLRSSNIMEDVVSRLGLNVQYYGHVFLRDVNLYKNTPIQVTPLREVKTPFTITINPIDETNFEFKIDGDGGWKKAHLGNKVSTKYGPIAFTKNKNVDLSDFTSYKITVRIGTVSSVAKRFTGMLQAVQPENYAQVVYLTFTCDNYEMGLDVLNALIVAYNQDAINDKNQVARSTESFIAERIESLSKDLSGVDSRVAQLKVNSMNSQIYANPGTSLQFEQDVSDVDMQINLANYIQSYLSNMQGNELIPSNTGIANTGIESSIAAYNEAMLKYQKIAATSSKENPVMVELTNSLASLRSNILRSLSNYINSLRIRQKQARSQASVATGSMAAVPSQEKAITEVARQQKIKEELYLYLLNKREENALQLAITEPNAKVIEKAFGSSGPVSPQPSRIMLMGILIGLAIPAAILFIIFWILSLDTMVHSHHDIEENCDIPIVGELPAKRDSQKNMEIMVSETGRDRISEAFRIVRSNLDYVLGESTDGQGRVIQLTSTMAGEGKSFISINLALTCAHIGKKIIAVDLDLRKGSFSDKIGLPNNGLGVSAFLSGKIDDIHDVITKGQLHNNLDVIGIGAIPPNPTNLLLSKRFEEMIAVLRKEYDIILLDTVPFGIIADASIINRSADLTIYIIRDGKVDKRYLSELNKMYQAQKIKNLTILLNDVKLGSRRYGYGGYGYGYGSYAGYGYGYGNYGYGNYGYTDDDENYRKRRKSKK